jgi:aerotaxis receptor
MDKTFAMFIETEVPKNELIISRTDLKGIITYANETFAEISGYTVDELIGKPHNIIRHPDMPKSVFKDLWETIQADKIWKGYVKNLRKDKGYYWVYTEISGIYKDGKKIGYKSMRSWIDKETRIKWQNIYDEMREKEGENVRTVMYLDVETFHRIENLANTKNKTGEQIIKELLNTSTGGIEDEKSKATT